MLSRRGKLDGFPSSLFREISVIFAVGGGGPGGVGAFLLDSLRDCVRKDGEAVGEMLLEEVQMKEMGQ